MDNRPVNTKPTLSYFLDSLFLSLSKDEQLDPDVVQLVIQHLGQDSIPTQAGKRLAKSIVDLAKERSRRETQ